MTTLPIAFMVNLALGMPSRDVDIPVYFLMIFSALILFGALTLRDALIEPYNAQRTHQLDTKRGERLRRFVMGFGWGGAALCWGFAGFLIVGALG